MDKLKSDYEESINRASEDSEGAIRGLQQQQLQQHQQQTQQQQQKSLGIRARI